jgi:hypothetical protein
MRGDALRALPAFLRGVMSRPAGDPQGGKMDADGAYTWLRSAYRTSRPTPPRPRSPTSARRPAT